MLDPSSQERARQEMQQAEESRWKRRSSVDRKWDELRGKRFIDHQKDTQFTDAWIILGIVITVVALIARNGFLLAGAVVLFVVPLIGALWNRVSLYGVDYTRKLSETRAFLGETIELTLEVRNRKFLPVTWLHVLDQFPANLPVSGHEIRVNSVTNQGEFLSFWNPGIFGRLTRRFTVECNKRGYYLYGPATLSTGDGFGMFSRRGTLPGQQRLIVYPKIYTAEELRLPAKNPFGERAADAHLVEDPLRYAGIRDWQPEDGLKRVHWKATARRQELLSRVYEPTQEPQVLIFLNVATMERHWLGHMPELMERAVSVAASLAALLAEDRVPVGLIANGVLPGSDQPLRLLPGRSPGQLVRILELLAAVTPFASAPIESLLLRESPRLPWGSTLLVVTAIAHDDLLAALLDLRRAGRKVALFTLAEAPPERTLPGITVYHLPHLVADVISPAQV
jgi:uncharacterized protein (DUF58 family)